MMQPFSPDQFVHYAMNMQQMQVTGFLNGRPIQPAARRHQRGHV
ncbi:MAG: hypothetical protein WDN28_26750 [Chthoniobacter sp.]